MLMFFLVVSGKLDAIELLVRSGAKINGISSELGTVTPLNYVIAYSTNGN